MNILNRKFTYKTNVRNQKSYITKYIAKKGSIAIDGVSLTVNSTDTKSFSVNIVPYTWSHTNFYELKVSSRINVEVDMLARYVSQNLK